MCGAQGLTLPAIGQYGVGMVFLPQEPASRMACVQEIERAIASEGQVLLGWRDVPTNNGGLSLRTKEVEPVIRQVFIARGSSAMDQDALERKLYIIRKKSGHAIQALKLRHGKEFYVPSMSSRTLVYKGMLLAHQVGEYFLDLTDESDGLGARDGAPALLDQHVSDVGSRASVPPRLPQRRDQHAARQRQLDPRATAGRSRARCWARISTRSGR